MFVIHTKNKPLEIPSLVAVPKFILKIKLCSFTVHCKTGSYVQSPHRLSAMSFIVSEYIPSQLKTFTPLNILKFALCEVHQSLQQPLMTARASKTRDLVILAFIGPIKIRNKQNLVLSPQVQFTKKITALSATLYLTSELSLSSLMKQTMVL